MPFKIKLCGITKRIIDKYRREVAGTNLVLPVPDIAYCNRILKESPSRSESTRRSPTTWAATRSPRPTRWCKASASKWSTDAGFRPVFGGH